MGQNCSSGIASYQPVGKGVAGDILTFTTPVPDMIQTATNRSGIMGVWRVARYLLRGESWEGPVSRRGSRIDELHDSGNDNRPEKHHRTGKDYGVLSRGVTESVNISEPTGSLTSVLSDDQGRHLL